MRLAGSPRHALRSTALSISIALLLSGCVSGKPVAEHLVEGAVSAESAPEPENVAGSSAAPSAASATEEGSATAVSEMAQQAPPPAEPGPLTLQGTGLKATSSSIFSTTAPASSTPSAVPQSEGVSGHSLFRATTPPQQPAGSPPPQPPLPQEDTQALPRPANHVPAAIADTVNDESASASLIGLFAAGGKSRKTADTLTNGKATDTDERAFAAGMAPQQVAALSYAALPGIGARSMFATVDDTAADHDDDSPTVEMASLSGLARLAPSGLLVQTDTVETGCFKPELMTLLKSVEVHFGRKLLVTSGHRSLVHNAKVGGRPASRHLTCEAADIQVPGIAKSTLATYLRSLPGRGGVGTYCHTQSVHIDTGRKRDWNWQCRTRDV